MSIALGIDTDKETIQLYDKDANTIATLSLDQANRLSRSLLSSIQFIQLKTLKEGHFDDKIN
jgi:hypothetical protein